MATRFIVEGANKDTGTEQQLEIEADDAGQAEQIANNLGLFVSAVQRVECPIDPSESSVGELIGNVDAICPHCNQALDRKPGRKKACPHCGRFIFVRTRPIDGEKVLVTEADAAKIAEQWFIARGGTHGGYMAEQIRLADEQAKQAERFTKERENLARRFGREPSENDVRWGLLNEDLLQHMKQHDWGFFRNTKFTMAEILRKEAKSAEALEFYLEICYLDLNGPWNTGGRSGCGIPDWSPELYVRQLAPGGLGRVEQMIQRANLEPAAVEQLFYKMASAVHTRLHLPLSPAKVWPTIRKSLYEDEGDG